jgi:hypothetical protein
MSWQTKGPEVAAEYLPSACEATDAARKQDFER